MQYRVLGLMIVDADSPEEAAQKAYEANEHIHDAWVKSGRPRLGVTWALTNEVGVLVDRDSIDREKRYEGEYKEL